MRTKTQLTENIFTTTNCLPLLYMEHLSSRVDD